MTDESKDYSGTPEKEDVKTFTQEELNQIVSERVNKVKANEEKAIAEALAKAKAEWEESQRISSLQGEEKLKAEFQKELTKAQKTMDTTSQQLADVQRELAITKAQTQLATLNLPTDLAQNLLGKDDAETAQRIQDFSKKVNELVTAKVNEAVARGAPSTTNANPTAANQQFAELAAAMRVH